MPTLLNRLDAFKRPPVEGGPSICLNMIVRNEAHVIRRCLASVKPLIKSWCIVDTGSTDGTQDIIREELSGIPGELHERAWVDFSTARNQAMDLAQSLDFDYLMVIDADEVLWCDPIRSLLRSDVYKITVDMGTRKDERVWLIRKGYPGKWDRPIHEDLEVYGEWTGIRGPVIRSMSDGARSKNPDRHNKDLQVLFGEIQKNPKDPRNYYYLGMTYLAAGDGVQAERALTMRMKFMGDRAERDRARSVLSNLQIASALGRLQ